MGDIKEKVVFASALCKEYPITGHTISALRGLNLEVVEGEFVSIYGPSGAGKTTLLNLIGGLDQPTSGEIVVCGHDLSTYDEDFLATFRSAYVGFVFQSYNLVSTLTALENVAFPMELAGWSGNRVEKRSEKLLKLVGLSHRTDHFPAQLSGGEQQRIAFARALANDPPLLLIDEPTGNLDVETGLEIVGIMEKLKTKGKTILVATHDERIVKLANRTLHLRDGRIVVVDE
ncbi:MAG: ABC transporter ATP-binding protein [Candidatus Bathyarchaeota archaeon]|nr:MAG: ABC transporter ATP-binding protein [Candidatus Bathyarchaeota archaeon]